MPWGGGTHDTATTGVSREPSARSAARRSAMARWATRPEVGLGDHEHVGDLHDPGLEELQHVAGGRLHDDRHRVGHVGHLGLGLAHADGLDDDHVEGDGQRAGGRPSGRGQAAEALRRRGRAHERGRVAGIDLDPRPVAEQRAARAA